MPDDVLPPNLRFSASGSTVCEAPDVAQPDLLLGASQREAAGAIGRALAARHAFVALTGAAGLGKTTLLARTVASSPGRPLRVVRVRNPDQVSAEAARTVEEVARQPAERTFAGETPTVVVVDDAHAASRSLLMCLTRMAAAGWSDPRSPQVVLAGRPELWDRLASPEFAPLVERIALRPVLQPLSDADVREVIKYALVQPRRIPGQRLTESAEQEVLRFADGKPGRVTALVSSALTLRDLKNRLPVSADMVCSAAAAVDGAPQGRTRGVVRVPVLVAALVAVVCAATAAAFVASEDRGWPPGRLVATAREFTGQAASRLAALAGDAPAVADDAGRGSAETSGGTASPVADRASPAGSAAPAPWDKGSAAEPADAAAPAPNRAAPTAAPVPMLAEEAGRGTAGSSGDASSPAPDGAAALTVPNPSPPSAGQPASRDQAKTLAEASGSDPQSQEAPPVPAPSGGAEPPAAEASSPAPVAGPPDTAGPGQEAAEASKSAVATPAEAPVPPAEPAAAASPPPAAAAGAEAGSLSPGVMARLLQRGDEMLAFGDVLAARRFYERTVSAGSALGAHGVAQTYDPAVLGQDSKAANPAAAAIWYSIAADLGDAAARARLQDTRNSGEAKDAPGSAP